MKAPKTFLAWGLQDASGYPIFAIYATRKLALQDEYCQEDLNAAKVVRVRVTKVEKPRKRKAKKGKRGGA